MPKDMNVSAEEFFSGGILQWKNFSAEEFFNGGFFQRRIFPLPVKDPKAEDLSVIYISRIDPKKIRGTL